MRNYELINDTIKELIEYQLKPHGKSWSDVVNDSDWFSKYTTTKKEQDDFFEYATLYIAKKLKMSKNTARKEAGWFILKWGLKVQEEEPSQKVKIK